MIIIVVLVYAIVTGEIDTSRFKDKLSEILEGEDTEYPKVEISELTLKSKEYEGKKIKIRARASNGWNYIDNPISNHDGLHISFIDDNGIEMFVKSPIYHKFDYYNPSFNPKPSKYIVKGIYHNGKINSLYQNSKGYIEATELIERA